MFVASGSIFLFATLICLPANILCTMEARISVVTKVSDIVSIALHEERRVTRV